MAASSVAGVYLHVMEDVINNVRNDFQLEGLDETVLHELQSLWELKLIQAGAISQSEIPNNRTQPPVPNPVQDLNIPYAGTEEFTPTTELLFSPYSTPTPGPMPDQTPGRRRGVDMNVAYEETQEEDENGVAPVTKDFLGKRKRDDVPGSYYPQHGSIPQRDGADDNYDNQVAEEDYNETAEEDAQNNDALRAQAQAQPEVADSEGSEPPLNEEDDDEDDANDMISAEDELNTTHLVLAQFEKVTRSKNKWKCVLKDGVMHLNNRDILFLKANGEFEF